jgi:diadenylate cyclase
MRKKSEIQENIIKTEEDKVTEEDFLSVLKTVAPGTNLRTAIDGALSTGKGALIVIENDKLLSIMDGGFRINTRFTPQKLIELTKMDGAIILSKDMKKINFANVLLTPDSKIKTFETGTRHKAAERTAKQIKNLTIAISERKNQITLYYKNQRYHLRQAEELLRKANENIQLLENQRELFDNHVERLNKSETQNYFNLNLAINLIQKGELIQKIAEDLKQYVVELGREGTLLKIRLREIKGGVERENDLIIKDYTKLDLKKSKVLLKTLTYEEILDDENILSALAYENQTRSDPIKGWRLLSKTSLQEQEIAQIIKETGDVEKILLEGESRFAEILSDKNKAQKFKEEIEKLKASF